MCVCACARACACKQLDSSVGKHPETSYLQLESASEGEIVSVSN